MQIKKGNEHQQIHRKGPGLSVKIVGQGNGLSVLCREGHCQDEDENKDDELNVIHSSSHLRVG